MLTFDVHINSLVAFDGVTLAQVRIVSTTNVNILVRTTITIKVFTYNNSCAIIQPSLINENINMKVLPIKFSDTQALKIKDVVAIVGTDASKVARAAMKLGLAQIQAMAARDVDKAIDLVLINDARSK